MPELADHQGRPSYADELGVLHRAHRRELKQIIADLPLKNGQRVLDIACGDGSYSKWLAERVRPEGLCVGFDLAIEYLAEAENAMRECECCELAAAKLEELPFSHDTFDLLWCAQSLVSLPEPVSALSQMQHFLRPGGLVVVLENDALHQIILPWPAELELAIREAELRCYRADAKRPEKRYAGRRLTEYFREAGLKPLLRKTYATDRMAPLSVTEAACLEEHSQSLAERISSFLAKDDKRAFDELIDPDSPKSLLHDPEVEVTWLDFVCWGEKPRV